MAYRITATTDPDKELLDRIRDLAWQLRQPISAVIRAAFETHLETDNGKRP